MAMQNENVTAQVTAVKTRIDWRAKLSSRKFWALVGSFAVTAGVLFRIDAETMTQVASLLLTLGAVVGYLLSEGKVDAAREAAQQSDTIINATTYNAGAEVLTGIEVVEEEE